jgi:hypothetical protein
MTDTISFKIIEDQKEFLIVFQGLCNIAESAFNKFDQRITEDPSILLSPGICYSVSHLMGITFTIMGMRGDYDAFKDGEVETRSFYVEIDGVIYDQNYLYKMNDYFASRCNQMLAILEKNHPEIYKSYSNVWKSS